VKKLFYLLTLATGAACQHQAPPLAKATAEPLAVAAPVKTAKLTPAAMAPADTLTPEMLTLLRQVDLAPLWAADTAYADGYVPMLGFLGADHYSISMVLDKVQQDAREPQLFHVRGRDRFRKVITPFEGTLRIQHVADFDSCYIHKYGGDSIRAYTASAVFSLRQEQRADAGVFSGEAFLDFYVTNDGYCGLPEKPIEGILVNGTPTKGSNRLFRGTWTSARTGQTKPLLVANDLYIIAPELYADFGVGDRGTQVNPKYAKLGWSEYWENSEWWAKSPKPSLSL
jgi:hypothetical protein